MARQTTTKTFDATADWDLGVAQEGMVSRWLVQIKGTGFTGSVQPEGRAKNTDLDFTNLAYDDAGDGVAGKTTAPTTDALIFVEGSGLDVRLAVTVTGGSVEIAVVPLAG